MMKSAEVAGLSDPATWPAVSVVVPCRNEAGFIESFVRDIRNQEYPGELEVLIAEGASTDDTRRRLEEMGKLFHGLRIIDSPGGQIASGLNRAINAASGEVIVRADVHTRYAPSYVRSCVRALIARRVDNVGGPWRAAAAERLMPRAIAVAFQSPLSSGNARSHDPNFRGPVDSVYLGCWWRERLLEMGGFDEQFLRSEDDELNFRLIKAGGQVWQEPEIHCEYMARSSLRDLFRQYFQWGYWKVLVMRKHGRPAALRHMVPACAAVAGLVLAGLAPFKKWALMVLLVAATLYLLVLIVESSRIALRCSSGAFAVVLPVVFATFHVAYGFGTLSGFMDFCVLRVGPRHDMKRLTR